MSLDHVPDFSNSWTPTEHGLILTFCNQNRFECQISSEQKDQILLPKGLQLSTSEKRNSYFANYEYAKIVKFSLLNIKLWLKDYNILYQFLVFE